MKRFEKMGCSDGETRRTRPRPRLVFLLPLFVASLFSLTTPVFAQTQDINLQDLPTRVAQALGMPVLAGQMLASGVVLIMFLLPLTLLTRRGRAGWLPEMVVSLVLLGFCIAIGWLPYWFLIIICLLIALMFSGSMRTWLTGGK